VSLITNDGRAGRWHSSNFSFNNEEQIIAGLFGRGRLPLRQEFCVDVRGGWARWRCGGGASEG
jgi:hypothetical protein